MSTDRDVTRIVRSWLDEGATALPDRVLDAVLDRVPATPQRRTFWPARRLPEMNSLAKILLSTAAVVAIAVVGFNVIPREGGFGGTPPSPTPTPTPSPTPTPLGAGSINQTMDPGTYRIADPFATPFVLTVGEGWHPTRIDLNSVQMTRAGDGSPWLVVERPRSVFPDPCHMGTAPIAPSEAPTVDSLVSALTTMQGFSAGPVTDVTIGRHAGKTFELTNSINADSPECPLGGLLNFWMFETPSGTDIGPGSNGGAIDHLWVIDVDGTPIAIDAMHFAGTSPGDITDVEAVAERIEFE